MDSVKILVAVILFEFSGSCQGQLPTCKSANMSYAILIDGSVGTSNDEFLKVKDFVKRLVTTIGISETSRFSLVQFATNATIHIQCNDYKTSTSFNTAVDSVTKSNGLFACTYCGLNQAEIALTTNGCSPLQNKVLLVILDRNANKVNKRVPTASNLRASGIAIRALGITSRVTDEELLELSGSDEHDRTIESYDDLANLDTDEYFSWLASSHCTTEPGPTCSSVDMSYAILIEGSNGVSNNEFLKLKDFVKRLVTAIGMSENSKFTLVQYATDATININCNEYTTMFSFNAVVDSVTKLDSHFRNVQRGLDKAEIALTTNGCSPSQNRVLFVIFKNDANTINPHVPTARNLRTAGITIRALGISSRVSDEELLKLTGSNELYRRINSYDDLENLDIDEYFSWLTSSYCITEREHLTQWSSWGSCSASCQVSDDLPTMVRSRNCSIYNNSCGGAALTQLSPCNEGVDCDRATDLLTQWSSWGSCSASCQVGDDSPTKVRIRDCSYSNNRCGGVPLSEFSLCNEGINCDEGNSQWIPVAIAVPVIAVIFACVLSLIWYKKRKRNVPKQMTRTSEKKQSTVMSHISRKFFEPKKQLRSDELPLRSNYETVAETNVDTLFDRWEIKPQSIKIIKEVGSGSFGKVYSAVLESGDLKTLSPSSQSQFAVKYLKDSPTEEEERSFQLEINLMKHIGHHENIINLVGCCTTSKPFCLVLDYMPYGDLLGYLRKSRTGGFNTQDPLGYELIENATELYVAPEDLLSFAWQIASGMEYLGTQNFVHRDLAARNVLVGFDKRLKIADFGLSRFLSNDTVYVAKTVRRLPIRWMAVESICHEQFTICSDVWAYGIVLFEIFTLGGKPYPGIPIDKLCEKLKNGYRLERPENIDKILYDIMTSCWHANPKDRPTFEKLRETFGNLLAQKAEYITLDINENAEYYWKPSLHGSDEQDDEEIEL